jgi:hypothetical protein
MSALVPIGTLANVAAVIVGGSIGLVLHRRMPESVRTIVFQGLGLCTLAIGMSMALKFTNPLPVIFSVVLGGVAGAVMRLEERFDAMAGRVKRAIGSKNDLFTDGMVTAFLIFCVGPMTVLGAFDEGLRADPTLLFTKSMLDGFASIALASTYGLGVVFSFVPLFLYQYALTLFAGALQQVFSEQVVTQLTATGGVLILGIGVNLLELKRIAISNLLPALAIIVALTWVFA